MTRRFKRERPRSLRGWVKNDRPETLDGDQEKDANTMAKEAKAISEARTPEELLMSMFSNIPGFGGKQITGDEVEFHEGNKISLPMGMTYEKAYKVLKQLEAEAETPTNWDHRFKYRADDGAYATLMVVKERYGMLMAKADQDSFGGTNPAQSRTISIGVNQTMQVPWGDIQIPVFEGLSINLCDRHEDKDYGKIFEIHATGPKKYTEEIEKFFEAIEDYLKTNSIYRGRAIIGSADPEFLDTSAFNGDQIVFADDVTAMLEGALWSPIKFTDAFRAENVPLKRALLAYGPYGTGKTSTGLLTAKVATDNGWTFISAKPGRDNVTDVLRTARLYQPAVVFIEDIDTVASTGDVDEVSLLLDAFDGITAKGGELMILMTTNHIEKIHRGMLRPGRLDAVIEIGGLDAGGVERLIKAVIPTDKLEDEIDFEAVGAAMPGFYPAFVRESITRAVTFAIARLGGERHYKLGTDDFVSAARTLYPQLAAQNDAGEGEIKPALNLAIGQVVADAIKGLELYEGGRDATITIRDAE